MNNLILFNDYLKKKHLFYNILKKNKKNKKFKLNKINYNFNYLFYF